MVRRLAVVLLWLACESRVVAIRSPQPSDPGLDASVECAEFEVDTQRVLTNVGLAASPQGVGFAGLEPVSGGFDLHFFIARGDGGLTQTATFDAGDESLVSAVASTDGQGFAVAFHRRGIPTLVRLDSEGRPVAEPLSVLAPGLGGAPPWGLRASAHHGEFAVVYRGMGATPGYAVQRSDGTVRLSGETFVAGQVDGLLQSDQVAFVAHDAPLDAQRLVSWHQPIEGSDGGPAFTTLFTGALVGRPVLCDALVLFGVADAGAIEIQTTGLAFGSAPAVVGQARSQSPRLLNAQCTANGAIAVFRAPNGDLQVVEVNETGARPLFSVPGVTRSTDFAVSAVGREVWLLYTANATLTAHLVRRCTSKP